LILVITGSGEFQYNRLLVKIDEMAPRIGIPILIQNGPVPFQAKHCRTLGLVPYRDLMELYRQATLIVSHTSSGPLIYARKFQKPIITVPRRLELGEAVANHQVETAAALMALPSATRVTLDGVENLENAIQSMLESIRSGLDFASDNGDLIGLQDAIRQACLK
jgi:beta-1,4-N-acetylglucosaminyltransferase